MPRIIPEDVAPQLEALALRSPDYVHWRRWGKLNADGTGEHWVRCSCPEAKRVVLKIGEIRSRKLLIGQCNSCGTIHWRELVADTTG